MNYAVIFTYSFDGETSVYLFADEKSAKKFLCDSYNEELRIDSKENGCDVAGEISADGWYAKITTVFQGEEDRTEIRIGTIYQ